MAFLMIIPEFHSAPVWNGGLTVVMPRFPAENWFSPVYVSGMALRKRLWLYSWSYVFPGEVYLQ